MKLWFNKQSPFCFQDCRWLHDGCISLLEDWKCVRILSCSHITKQSASGHSQPVDTVSQTIQSASGYSHLDDTVSQWIQSARRYSQPVDTVSQWIQSARRYSQPVPQSASGYSHTTKQSVNGYSQPDDTVSQWIQSARRYSQPVDTVSQWPQRGTLETRSSQRTTWYVSG